LRYFIATVVKTADLRSLDDSIGPRTNPLWTSPNAPSPSWDSLTRQLDGISHSSSRGMRFRRLYEFELCRLRLQKSGSRSPCDTHNTYNTGHEELLKGTGVFMYWVSRIKTSF
jgi:hypothetical protein